MADTPLLQDQLTIQEQINLAQVTNMPGFDVIIKMFDAGCNLATEEVMKLDPADPQYTNQVVARQTEAHSTHKFSNRVRKSILYHSGIGMGAVSKPRDQKPIEPKKRFAPPAPKK